MPGTDRLPLRQLTVLGTGYLGAAHAACLADMGFGVLGVDPHPGRAAALNSGQLPFWEPGLAPMLRRAMSCGRLRFSTSYAEAADFADVHFICVGTPQLPGRLEADVSQLTGCVDELAPLLHRPSVVIGKSTGPVGTAAMLAARLARNSPAGAKAELAWNPEFLREGHAVADTLCPDRIVAGVRPGKTESILREIYARPLAAGVPFLVTDFATAELAKVAANAFLATKISFINAMSEVCEAAGADVLTLAGALGHDSRIGPASLRPGAGFGGGCLPKDIRAFQVRADQLGTGDALSFLSEIDAINLRCRRHIVTLAREMAGGSFAGRTVGVLGAAFKPGSDDVRDSPALDIASSIRQLGGAVTVYDPVASARALQAHPELAYAGSAVGAACDADVLLVLTDWDEFADADPEVLGKAVTRRCVIDGRHMLDAARWRAAGWAYRAPGRPQA
jgi:UDPglucose 6-dehydrogenase